MSAVRQSPPAGRAWPGRTRTRRGGADAVGADGRHRQTTSGMNTGDTEMQKNADNAADTPAANRAGNAARGGGLAPLPRRADPDASLRRGRFPAPC